MIVCMSCSVTHTPAGSSLQQLISTNPGVECRWRQWEGRYKVLNRKEWCIRTTSQCEECNNNLMKCNMINVKLKLSPSINCKSAPEPSHTHTLTRSRTKPALSRSRAHTPKANVSDGGMGACICIYGLFSDLLNLSIVSIL